jgi:hypothetical protein
MKIKNQIETPLITGSLLQLTVILLPVIYIKPADMLKVTLPELCEAHPGYSYLVTGLLVIFGTDSVISGWKHMEGLAFTRFMLVLFGFTFTASSLLNYFSHNNSLASEMPLSIIHRCLAGMTLISFSAMTFSAAFVLDDERNRKRSFLAGFAIILLSIFQIESVRFAGLWQKLILLIISGWIIAITRYTDSKR